EARRIDNQLRGRSGRQGDPGSTQFFVSLEDELMQRFGADKIKNLMDMLKVPEDQPIENKMISGAIEKAQAKIEGYNFDIRKHVLDYDEVMNKQREAIYGMRKEILFDSTDGEIHNKVEELMNEEESKQYQEKIKDLPIDEVGNLEKFVMLRTIDMLWMEHLETMECLRDSVGLRAYGQHDPLVEYKNEGHRLFGSMMNEINNEIVNMLLKVEMNGQDSHQQHQHINSQIEPKKNQVGRNDPCPCGSGKKYKKCCGK
ncbi:MAG: SEC-C metal-binding domain-containing protein, partial [Candidatus Portnoybacteria bacterium]|nr:SEC-C metal-binding domain-containing protein [Candidatus Portnoybacteria bacterium]